MFQAFVAAITIFGRLEDILGRTWIFPPLKAHESIRILLKATFALLQEILPLFLAAILLGVAQVLRVAVPIYFVITVPLADWRHLVFVVLSRHRLRVDLDRYGRDVG